MFAKSTFGSRPTRRLAARGRSMGAIQSLFEESTAQSAFVFIKPHANTPQVRALCMSKFAEAGISVLGDGEITGPEIDSQGFIDQHYYAIASKATILKPKDLNVPLDKFKENFSEDWPTVLAEERVFNAIDVQAKLGISPDELEEKWDKSNKVKFGGGFYCACIDTDKKIYTFNAFFMRMRGRFTAPNTSIHYFLVEFEPSILKWADFRALVLGPTDPAKAPTGSLRCSIYTEWQTLGLSEVPDTGNNGVHASASPFEGFAERVNWLKIPISSDPFGSKLLAAGIDGATLKAWTVDPQVLTPGGSGAKKSLFDQLEDMDVKECVDTCKAIATANDVQVALAPEGRRICVPWL